MSNTNKPRETSGATIYFDGRVVAKVVILIFVVMVRNFFIAELESEAFGIRVKEVGNDSKDLRDLGVDYVHKSGAFPAVLIKEVKDFQDETLKEIAEVKQRIWNQSQVGFLYVTSPFEIRIYDCNQEPFNLEVAIKESSLAQKLKAHELNSCNKRDLKKLKELKQVFSFAAIDSGALWNRENPYQRKISRSSKLEKRLVLALKDVAIFLQKDKQAKVDDVVIHSLLMRSLFIMYLQDNAAIPDEIWKQVGHRDYLRILSDVELTYQFFDLIVPHFNGNLFPVSQKEKEQIRQVHLLAIKGALSDGIISAQPRLFDWRLFDFRFIRVELLSEVYENFLESIDPAKKRLSGTYYTPLPLVDLILEQVLPVNSTDYQVKVLDPACGSGNFLVQAFKRIVARWQVAHPGVALTFGTLKRLMQDSIYGVEIDRNSIRVAAFSLYLTLLSYLDPQDIWLKNGEKFPDLIRDRAEGLGATDARNLFREDTITNGADFEQHEFDIVVGNPPFGDKQLPAVIKNYCVQRGFAQQHAIPFMHKLIQVAPEAKIAFVFNSKLLFNLPEPSVNFRRWLFNDCYVERIFNLSILRKTAKTQGGQLFPSATVPVSVVFYQAVRPSTETSTIEYWAPKTSFQNQLTEGVLIGTSDIKHLPRSICENPTSSILKIAQWGTISDYYLIEKIQAKAGMRLSEYLEVHQFIAGSGFQPISEAKVEPKVDHELKELGYMAAENVERYHTPEGFKEGINACIQSKKGLTFYTKLFVERNRTLWPDITHFRFIGGKKKRVFRAPHVLIKEGMSNNEFCASYLDYSVAFRETILGIAGGTPEMLKAMVGYLNSTLSSYLLFLTASSWGVERDRVKNEEIYDLPGLPKRLDLAAVAGKVDEIIALKKREIASADRKTTRGKQSPPMLYEASHKSDIAEQISALESSIKELIYDGFGLSETERILVEEFKENAIDLFTQGARSAALMPLGKTAQPLVNYAAQLCKILNHEVEDPETTVIATVYAPQTNASLCLVVIRFVDSGERRDPVVEGSSQAFDQALEEINAYTVSRYSTNVFLQKQVRYFSGDDIYLLKPNQKRFWTRSSAVEDANSILGEMVTSAL